MDFYKSILDLHKWFMIIDLLYIGWHVLWIIHFSTENYFLVPHAFVVVIMEIHKLNYGDPLIKSNMEIHLWSYITRIMELRKLN